MANKILAKRICKLISMSYAVTEQEVEEAYDKTNSIDVVLEATSSSVRNGTTLQFEIMERKQ